MSTVAITTAHAFHRCVRLLQELHRLLAAGQDDSDEAEACRAQMDPLWYAMTAAERERIGGLSEDLYILAEGGAKQAALAPPEKARWAEEATTVLARLFAERDVDTALKFLRQPIPEDRPRSLIPFLQALCWEMLGEGELALRFMQEAARLDPCQAVCVLLLLEQLGHTEAAAACAQRLLGVATK